ncbi:hypothetical protein GUJ93_ZPchr0002g26643 [Zizania palustris]|uniref:Uncharacterized protein n=1 Tax=Zizania palustris TaxID=103762 RepID=A0A8J5S6Y1_ZIZPA|nr:hypothetical protein GUJ93_ZPchr0002g26643 [Zizania palustris]
MPMQMPPARDYGGVGHFVALAAEPCGKEDGAAVTTKEERRRSVARCVFAVVGIMSTLLVYGVLQIL